MNTTEQFEGFAVTNLDACTEVTKVKFNPRPFGEIDIDVKIHACGICGLDCHTISGGWGKVKLPRL